MWHQIVTIWGVHYIRSVTKSVHIVNIVPTWRNFETIFCLSKTRMLMSKNLCSKLYGMLSLTYIYSFCYLKSILSSILSIRLQALITLYKWLNLWILFRKSKCFNHSVSILYDWAIKPGPVHFVVQRTLVEENYIYKYTPSGLFRGNFFLL